MRNNLRLSFSTIAALIAVLFAVANLTGCASTSKKDDAEREAYVAKRTKYYLGEGGLSDPMTASTAANADWDAGKALEDTDKRLGLGQYKEPEINSR